jgi:hypothetical protein
MSNSLLSTTPDDYPLISQVPIQDVNLPSSVSVWAGADEAEAVKRAMTQCVCGLCQMNVMELKMVVTWSCSLRPAFLTRNYSSLTG